MAMQKFTQGRMSLSTGIECMYTLDINTRRTMLYSRKTRSVMWKVMGAGTITQAEACVPVATWWKRVGTGTISGTGARPRGVLRRRRQKMIVFWNFVEGCKWQGPVEGRKTNL